MDGIKGKFYLGLQADMMAQDFTQTFLYRYLKEKKDQAGVREDWLEQLKAYLMGNFRYVKDFLDQHVPGVTTFIPGATYLMWLDCRGLGMDQEDLVRFLVEKAGLGLSSGSGFGLDGFMRLNAACPRSVLERAMAQLAQAVADRQRDA